MNTLQDDMINMHKLLIVLADKIDPYLVSGANHDRDVTLKEPIPKVIAKINKEIGDLISVLNECLVLH